jgi:hypothetical protein
MGVAYSVNIESIMTAVMKFKWRRTSPWRKGWRRNGCGEKSHPPLERPSFSGQYTEWTAFHDTFSSLIENNDQLSGVQKSHYLKSCLKREAGKVIELLTISNKNYNFAWVVLIKRYDNQRLIIQDYIFAIVKAPPVQKSSHDNLRQLFDNFNIHMEPLKVQNIDTSTWNQL